MSSSSFAGAFRMYSLQSDLQYSQLQPFLFFLVGLFCFTSLFSSRTGRSFLLLRELPWCIPWTVICNVHSCNRYFSFVWLFCFTSLISSGTGRSFLLLRERSGCIPWTVICNVHSCNRSLSFVGLCFALPLSFRRGLADHVFFFCGSFPDVFPGQWFAIFTVATVPFLLSDCFALPLSFRRGLVDHVFFCGSFPDVFPGQWLTIFKVTTVPFLLSDYFALPLSFRRGLVDHVFFFCGSFSGCIPWTVICNIHSCNRSFSFVGLFCFTFLLSSGTGRSFLLSRELSWCIPWTVICNIHSCNRFVSFCRTVLLYLCLFVEDW